MRLTGTFLSGFAAVLLALPAQNINTQGQLNYSQSGSQAPAVVLWVDESDSAGQSPEDLARRPQSIKTQAASTDIPVKPNGTITLNFAVRNNGGSGEVIPNSGITIKLEPGSFNGGHEHHGTPRPLGAFEQVSFNTGTSGVVPVKYTAPAISGQVLINGSCTSGDGSSCTWNPGTFAVSIPDLQALPASTLYNLTGAVTGKHTSNHWGTPATNEAVANLAFRYYAAPETSTLTGNAKKLLLNDMSLQWGGVYDCFPCKDTHNNPGVEWQPPHAEHRLGTNVDLSKSTVPRQLRAFVEQQIKASGFSIFQHSDHWHLRYVGTTGGTPRGAPPQDSQEQADGSLQASAAVAVQPTVQVVNDTATGLFTYQYSFRNDTGSTLEINDITISLNGAQAFSPVTPQGWTAAVWRDGTAINFSATDAGAPTDATGDAVPSPFQIKPGQTLGGFSFVSVSSPGTATFYANGFKQTPVTAGDDVEDDSVTPSADFTGTTQGPAFVKSAANPIDDPQLFVRQHYVDFLNRDPDASGFQFWLNEINGCGSNSACREVKRINVSAAYFLSIEFQQTGYLICRLNRASFGSMPRFLNFLTDAQLVGQRVVVGQFGWEQKLEANKKAFVETWVGRDEFKTRYDAKTNAQYVDSLIANTGVAFTQAERAALVNGLTSGTETRATVLRKVAENEAFTNKEKNAAFVLMQYFGYLRRNPDDAPDADLSGYNFWLSKLNSFGGDFQRAEMVKAFLSSIEYRQRFGQ